MSYQERPTPIVRTVGLGKTYSSGAAEVAAVRSVSLDIPRGGFVAVMGASGSGKSTLMNLLGCLDRPTAGEYLLDGVAVAGLNRRALAAVRNAKLGFVFQSFNLLARATAVENVELPLLYASPVPRRRERRERAVLALERVGLGGRLGHRPSELSGGQQQRVAVARALVTGPELVLADEPTGNLDSRAGAGLMCLFRGLNDAGMTVVVVTHEPDISAYAKRLVVMRDGAVVSDRVNDARRDPAADLAALDLAAEREGGG